MAGMAQSAVDSLLGRLTSLLVEEAKLLRGVHGDVQFIKEEMESMNGLLAHLTEAQHRDHHVRAWMKQVVSLARDSEGYVELYVRHVAEPRAGDGLLGCLRRLLRMVRTIPVRHRVAARIRELRSQTREVGERRLRYGIAVPSAAEQQGLGTILFDFQNPPPPEDQESLWVRALLDLDEERVFNKGADRIVRFLFEKKKPPAPHDDHDDEPMPVRIVSIVRTKIAEEEREKKMTAHLAGRVWDHTSVVSSFACKAWVQVGECHDVGILLLEIMRQVAPDLVVLPPGQEEAADPVWGNEDREVSRLASTLKTYLSDKRFLIVLEDVFSIYAWEETIQRLPWREDDCVPGSAIMVTTNEWNLFWGSKVKPYPYKIFTPRRDLYCYFYYEAESLNQGHDSWERIKEILDLCYPDAFAMKMFLHLLHANPRRTPDELKSIHESLAECIRLKKSIGKQMLVYCYNELPRKYKSCLLYLSIFPKGRTITRTCLARRWIGEGLINPARDYTDRRSNNLYGTEEDIAKRFFDVLVTKGFIRPAEISDACNVRRCNLHHETSEFIARIAIDVNLVDIDLPQNLAQHLSIHNRTTLQHSLSQLNHPTELADDIVMLLPYLAKSTQWQLLKVLDLEGCKGLKKKRHLRAICKILLLKYLSLRDTDVTELPKQMEKLQCLETLDIRQTRIRAFPTKSVVLPMLKHLLAGHSESARNSSGDRLPETFTTVRLPSGIRRMRKLVMLSHVQVSHNAADLVGIGQLIHLRKLGVVLHCKKDACLGMLLQQVEKLHGCLRSLSIRVKLQMQEGVPDADEVVALATPPKLLRSLNITGITNGLPPWVTELDQLVKITLRETYLGEDALRILGNLRALSCLRLRHKSCIIRELHIRKREFINLKSLVVEGSDVTHIKVHAAPMLEMIVWSFARMEGLTGIGGLGTPMLRKVVLNGDCDPDPTAYNIMCGGPIYTQAPILEHNGQLIVPAHY